MSDELFDMFMDEFEVSSNEKRKEISRAPFGYPGGKSASVEMLNKYLPVRYSWIDHFCGSGVVTLNRPESKLEVMNDRYGGLVSFHRCMKDTNKHQELHDYLATMLNSREEWVHAKMTYATEVDDVVRAAKWYYIQKLSVMGKGKCFGRSTNSALSLTITDCLHLWKPIHYRLKNVLVENLDFRTAFKDFDSHNAVHYCDPPYIDTDGGLYEGTWTRNDLGDLLRCIKDAKGFCALSGYYDEQIDKCDFWTARYSWEVRVMEPNCFTETNNKEKHSHMTALDKTTEYLWVKG